jgi:DNA-binding CsgD family transcriptional regulator
MSAAYAALPSFAAAVCCLLIAVFTLAVGGRSAANRWFAALVGWFAVWSAGVAGSMLTAGFAATVWQRVGYFGGEAYCLTGVWFFAALSGYSPRLRRPWIVGLIAAPYLVVMTANLGWNAVARDFPDGPWQIAHHVVGNAATLGGLALVVLSIRRERPRRDALRLKLTVAASLIALPPAVWVDFALGSLGYPSQSNLIAAVWALFVFIAFAAAGALGFRTDAEISSLFDGVDDGFALFDPSLRTVRLNAAAAALVGRPAIPTGADAAADDLIEDFGRHRPVLRRLAASGGAELDLAVRFKPAGGGAAVLRRLSVRVVRDRWKDPVAYVGVLRRDDRFERFAAGFALSGREREVLELTLSGAGQQAMARTLGIRLPTVKTYRTNLYNKLGVNSRGELLALLREFA